MNRLPDLSPPPLPIEKLPWNSDPAAGWKVGWPGKKAAGWGLPNWNTEAAAEPNGDVGAGMAAACPKPGTAGAAAWTVSSVMLSSTFIWSLFPGEAVLNPSAGLRAPKVGAPEERAAAADGTAVAEEKPKGEGLAVAAAWVNEKTEEPTAGADAGGNSEADEDPNAGAEAEEDVPNADIEGDGAEEPKPEPKSEVVAGWEPAANKLAAVAVDARELLEGLDETPVECSPKPGPKPNGFELITEDLKVDPLEEPARLNPKEEVEPNWLVVLCAKREAPVPGWVAWEPINDPALPLPLPLLTLKVVAPDSAGAVNPNKLPPVLENEAAVAEELDSPKIDSLAAFGAESVTTGFTADPAREVGTAEELEPNWNEGVVVDVENKVEGSLLELAAEVEKPEAVAVTEVLKIDGAEEEDAVNTDELDIGEPLLWAETEEAPNWKVFEVVGTEKPDEPGDAADLNKNPASWVLSDFSASTTVAVVETDGPLQKTWCQILFKEPQTHLLKRDLSEEIRMP